jgi:hypothetical protein
VASDYCGNLSWGFAGHAQGQNLISLCAGQLSVLHHSFTLAGKVREGNGNGFPIFIWWLYQSAAVII